MSMCTNFVYIVVVFGFCFIDLIKCDIIVNTADGKVRGYERTNRNGEIFFAFRSIPYAEPPVNDLRFKAPLPTTGWNGILNATEDIPICYQGATGQEDCLYLSVFTKNVPTVDSMPKTVMVFFHGGGFVMMGPQEDYYNPEHLLTEDIVLVTAAYRLGFLGFLNLGVVAGSPITANAGMKDQVLVLKWVQKNIAVFGGDKNSVTIFGESAGACSVHLHMFSPLSRGLFHRAILQSGTALNTWSIGKPGSGEIVAERLNIATTNLTEALQEMQKVDVELIYKIQNEGILNDPTVQSLTSPVVEGNIPGAFLSNHPKYLLESGDYSHTPMIIGLNTKEGIYVHIMMTVAGTPSYLYDLKNLVPYDLNIPNEETLNEVISKLEQFYFDGHKPNPDTDVLKMIDLITDLFFVHGIANVVRSHYLKGDLIYLYEFGADTELNFFKKMLPETAEMDGASHMDELGYLFKNIKSPPVEDGSVENRMIEKMVQMWTNFAIGENPTPNGSDIQWRPVAIINGDINYFKIRNDAFTNELKLLQERVQFWDDLYEAYG